MISIECFEVGILQTNCYIIQDNKSGKVSIVDPGAKSTKLLERLKKLPLNSVEYILLTHGHFDHIGNADNIRKEFGGKIVIAEKEKDFLSNSNLNLSLTFFDKSLSAFSADIYLKDNESILFENNKITMIETPGHTVGGACYIIENNLFSGDTLMKESMGRTDFPTGNLENIFASLKRLGNLPQNYNVFPGHGENSTLDYERLHNINIGKMTYDNLY